MAKSSTPKKRPLKKVRPNKLTLWLKHYLNEPNPETFLNKTASAKAAKYQAKSENAFQVIGYQNFIKHQPLILKWLNDNKLSDTALRLKLSDLLETERTVFHKIKGKVNGEDLPAGIRVVAESSKMSYVGRGEDAEAVDDGETLLAINVADPEIQRKSLDMAFKVTGEYAAEKREHGGIGGGPIPLTAFPPEPASIEEWEKNRKIAEAKRLPAGTT